MDGPYQLSANAGRLVNRTHLQIFVFFSFILGIPLSHAAEAMIVRIGDRNLSVKTMGRAGPTIVFESGQGLGMENWDQVSTAVAACARVVVYDRLGVGRSSPWPGEKPVLASEVADRLAHLLKRIDARAPYILVGHSLGGLYVQSFVRRYPKTVAAVVLVDASSPLEPPGVFAPSAPPKAGTISAAEESGVTPSVSTLLTGPPFPPVPLVVVAATDHADTAEREALWRNIQARTAALSPQGRLQVAFGSGHFVQTDRPQMIVDAILEAGQSAGLTFTGCKK